ncbi:MULTISPECIES: hypothetical protein [Corynebacterium]|uniref:hypothetical protein n=1 Tax=Corynebacterium TaxID=1716 RepID=UPI0016597715|nr:MULTISPECIES: hypothetical protein [Corynebacterium]QNP92379.1 hypothetical protein IAU67_00635 [Corynebacterium zhongnanshanii]
MDINALIESISHFFTTDIGAIIWQLLRGVYEFLFPANAEAAHDIPLPIPTPPAE